MSNNTATVVTVKTATAAVVAFASGHGKITASLNGCAVLAKDGRVDDASMIVKAMAEKAIAIDAKIFASVRTLANRVFSDAGFDVSIATKKGAVLGVVIAAKKADEKGEAEKGEAEKAEAEKAEAVDTRDPAELEKAMSAILATVGQEEFRAMVARVLAPAIEAAPAVLAKAA